MFNRGKSNHIIDIMFPIVLLFVFALSATVVMLFAANIYGKTVEQSEHHNDARTSIIYVTEKVRQNDVAGNINIGSLDGHQALVINQNNGGEACTTYIYQADGELRELFTKADYQAKAEDGTTIMKIKDLKFEEYSKGMLRVSCTGNDGEIESALVSIRSAD